MNDLSIFLFFVSCFAGGTLFAQSAKVEVDHIVHQAEMILAMEVDENGCYDQTSDGTDQVYRTSTFFINITDRKRVLKNYMHGVYQVIIWTKYHQSDSDTAIYMQSYQFDSVIRAIETEFNHVNNEIEFKIPYLKYLAIKQDPYRLRRGLNHCKFDRKIKYKLFRISLAYEYVKTHNASILDNQKGRVSVPIKRYAIREVFSIEPYPANQYIEDYY